jgi:hypothetical protein
MGRVLRSCAASPPYLELFPDPLSHAPPPHRPLYLKEASGAPHPTLPRSRYPRDPVPGATPPGDQSHAAVRGYQVGRTFLVSTEAVIHFLEDSKVDEQIQEVQAQKQRVADFLGEVRRAGDPCGGDSAVFLVLIRTSDPCPMATSLG